MRRANGSLAVDSLFAQDRKSENKSAMSFSGMVRHIRVQLHFSDLHNHSSTVSTDACRRTGNSFSYGVCLLLSFDCTLTSWLAADDEPSGGASSLGANKVLLRD